MTHAIFGSGQTFTTFPVARTIRQQQVTQAFLRNGQQVSPSIFLEDKFSVLWIPAMI